MKSNPEPKPQFTPKPMTLGDLKRQIEALDVPDEATIKFAHSNTWRFVEHLSYCRPESELSLW